MRAGSGIGWLFLVAVLGVGSLRAAEAASTSVFTVNVAKVKPGKLATARQYYERAWLPARREAAKRGWIKSFQLLMAPRENASEAEIVLITEFADAVAYEKREEHFQEIFRALKVTLPVTVDGLSRSDIFQATTGLEDYRLVESGAK